MLLRVFLILSFFNFFVTQVYAETSRPINVILILMDDMGWRDVGFAGNRFVETPNIDLLAKQGVSFSQAYASAPNCAPTRACLLSGQYTPRHQVYTVVDPRHDPGQPSHKILSTKSNDALPDNCITLAEALKTKGYATAIYGMWNLGRGRSGAGSPQGQGFDIYKNPKDLGFEQNVYFDAEGRYLTDVLTDESLSFMERNKERPFFLYLPSHGVHAPFEPKKELLEKYQQKKTKTGGNDDPIYAAMIEAEDQNVGRIIQKVKELRLDQQTMIIFTSDNGGTPQYVAPLNGSKGALYEGGIRVPCAIWWAGIKNPGRVVDQPVLSMDFYPTIMEATGIKLSAEYKLDGISLLPVLSSNNKLPERSVYWHFPCYIGKGEPSSAVRMGDWKLIQKFAQQEFELYNLKSDPGETRNLFNIEPMQAKRLYSNLSTWQKQLQAPCPSEPNPNFDPSSVKQGGNKKGKKEGMFNQGKSLN